MTKDIAFEKTRNLLEKYNQQQLLAFWDQLDSAGRERLLSQIQRLDLPRIDEWIQKYVLDSSELAVHAEPEPADYYRARPRTEQQARYDEAADLGKKLLSQGKVAGFVVAGGQGTRLGFDGPKGNYPISPVKNKTLFRLFAEYIAAANARYDSVCPWYVMTSPLNHEPTEAIFRENDWFGLPEDSVTLFQQGTMPNFSFNGNILLAEKDSIACSPDGHGGSLKALYDSGALDDMAERGIEYISYWQVDNPLINIFDPLFIGLHAMDDSDMSSKAVIKTGPFEKVGNFCLIDGKMSVIEYSDLPDELAEKRSPDGSLAFELGSIAIHMINRKFVEKLNEKGFSLPWHKAIKKIPHIDARGNRIEPDEPNGVKLESFIFDALPLTDKSIILETVRESEFAPVKNAKGVDSAPVSREMITERAADWIESAGVSVPRKDDGSPDCVLEIAPSFALYKEDMASKADQIPQIKPGDEVYLA